MANEFKAAGIYAELGFKINKQELKQLTEFKKSIQEVKRALGSKTSTAGIAKVTSELKKQKAVNKSMLSDLKVQNAIKKAELDLEKRLAKVSSSRRGTERSAFSRAKKGLLADPTSAGMAKFRDKATAIKLRADEHALVIVKETTKANNKKAESINKISTATRRAKAAEAKKSFKSAVSGLTESSNPRLKSMASYYKQEERAARAAAKAVETEAHAMNRSYNAAKRRAHAQKSLNQQMREFRTTLLRSTQAYTAYATVLNTAQVGSTFEGIRAQYKSVFGREAVSEMAYVREEADRLGVSITDTAKAYAKFTFSAQMMGTSVEDSKKFFRQLQEAGAGLGLSNEEITGTTKAFSDMMAKGTVNKLAA